MRHPEIPDGEMRDAAIRTCQAFNGHEGCSCASRSGQYCESMSDALARIFFHANVRLPEVVALINGQASVRWKPGRKPNPKAPRRPHG